METTNQIMEIAKTIVAQIKYGDPYFLMAVGARNLACLSETKERMGGLEFQCNGLVHKGWCKVELKYNDTYRILFVNRKREVVKTVDECYCDQLIEILDFVEGK
jgi:hypothetical protein